MKAKLVLAVVALCFSFGMSLAQDYKITYEMKWKPTKTASEYQKELFVLLTHENAPSDFLQYNRFRQDSTATKVITEYFKKNTGGDLMIPDGGREPIFSAIITKDIANKKIKVEDKAFASVFETTYPCAIHWNLEKEATPEKIMGYSVQKATTQFGGRDWTAFYTPEIPIYDGSYKFYGLPGLILKIEDATGDYAFEIKAITKESTDISQRNFMRKKDELTPKQWEAFWKKYHQQPSMILENLNSENLTYVIEGKSVADREVKENYDKKEKARLAHFENPIELKNTCTK